FASGFVFFFTLFLFFGWAAAIWVQPAGPALNGVFYTGPLVASLLLWLILLAIVPAKATNPADEVIEEKMRVEVESPKETRNRHAFEAGVSAFFWFALFGMIVVIAVGSAS
ncbi:MAG: hypothetical protein R3242_04020, partial [Akkermansiaceae bacterium]|nr:hypothetical protein [Akkermansiaceae bacterium]